MKPVKMDLSSQQQLVQVMERMQVQLNELVSPVNVIKTDLRGSRDAAPAPPAAERARPLDRSPAASPEEQERTPSLASPRRPTPRTPSLVSPRHPTFPGWTSPSMPTKSGPPRVPPRGPPRFSGAPSRTPAAALRVGARPGGFSRATARGSTRLARTRRSRRTSATLFGPPLRAGAPQNPTLDIVREHRMSG